MTGKNSEIIKRLESRKKNKFTMLEILKQIINLREINLLLMIILIFIIMSFASPYFLTWGNIETILLSFSTEGIVVIGMTIMIIIGGIDISVGAVMCFAMVVPGQLFLHGMNAWAASAIGLLISGLLGAVIGFFVTKIKLNFFITTIAMMGIVRGACLIVTKGTPLSLWKLPDSFKFIGQGKVLGIPFVIILFFIIVIICDFMLRKTSLLRKVFYVGSNEKAALFSGMNVNKIKFWVSVFCSLLTGLAGIIFMARFTSATPIFGIGLELTAISAAVIGGASLTGGKGSVTGAILGITLLSMVTSSLILLDVNVYWQDFIKGLILLAAISLDSIGQMRKR
jgi:ribose transport system permease protein